MKLSEIKSILPHLDQLTFQLENGKFVPHHFHITEVGIIEKKFIDCGGSVRNEKLLNFQLWNADDVNHRLRPAKLLKIITLSESILAIEDLEIEVEYQSDTIGKYGLKFKNDIFVLTNKLTNCLAPDSCGIVQQPLTVNKESKCISTADCC